MQKRVVKSLILFSGLLTSITYADDIVITKPAGYTGTGPEKIVIMDRNLGATSNDVSSPDSYGYKFQRGNNHGFSDSESITPITQGLTREESYAHKGYNSTDFIKGSSDTDYDVWADKSHHDNLWGGENDNASNNRGLDDIETTQKNRQGPCPDGYHVPSAGEWSKLFEYRCINNPEKCSIDNMNASAGLYWQGNNNLGNNFRTDLKIPFAGYRDYSSASLLSQGVNGFYWSSSPYGSASPKIARFLYLNSSYVRADYYDRAYAFSVRCFHDFNIDFSSSPSSLFLSASSGDLISSEEVVFSNGHVSGVANIVSQAIERIKEALHVGEKYFIQWYQTNAQGVEEKVDIETIESDESLSLSGKVEKKDLCNDKTIKVYHGALN